jgi:hypothetical protein
MTITILAAITIALALDAAIEQAMLRGKRIRAAIATIQTKRRTLK